MSSEPVVEDPEATTCPRARSVCGRRHTPETSPATPRPRPRPTASGNAESDGFDCRSIFRASTLRPSWLRICERMGWNLRYSGFTMRKTLRTRGPEPIRNSESVLRNGFLRRLRVEVAETVGHTPRGSGGRGSPLGDGSRPPNLRPSGREGSPTGSVARVMPRGSRGFDARPHGSRASSFGRVIRSHLVAASPDLGHIDRLFPDGYTRPHTHFIEPRSVGAGRISKS